MESFRNYLKQDFIKRVNKNPKYSLRSYANYLQINHATLSSLLSGKRKITQNTVEKLSDKLNIDPKSLHHFLSDNNDNDFEFKLIEQDMFALMSLWYFDAIIELSTISKFDFNFQNIAKTLNITKLQAREAVTSLRDFGLLVINDDNKRVKAKYPNTSNILNDQFTSSANRKYQMSILSKSIEAVEEVGIDRRSHTSTTMAVNFKDLKKAKKMINEFRKKLTKELQIKSNNPDEVYQLQISFFPLTNNLKNIKNKREDNND